MKRHFRAKILRKQEDLPRYIVIPPDVLTDQTAAFEAEVSIDGAGPFARNIRPWRKGSDVYFFNLTQQQCRVANVDVGDEAAISLEPRQTHQKKR